MAKIIKTVIQLRRDTTANWDIHKSVVPAAGEPCYDIDKHTLRIGDGTTTYENLPEIGAGASGGDIDLTELWEAINDKADSGTTLADYGITDAMTADEVTAAIEAAVSAGINPGTFEIADAAPTADDAQDGVLYLVKNDSTGHYDIHVKVGDEVVKLDDTGMDLPAATMEALGMVKGSEAENGVKVNEDGTMTVHSLNVNKLVQTEGEDLILDGGGAN